MRTFARREREVGRKTKKQPSTINHPPSTTTRYTMRKKAR